MEREWVHLLCLAVCKSYRHVYLFRSCYFSFSFAMDDDRPCTRIWTNCLRWFQEPGQMLVCLQPRSYIIAFRLYFHRSRSNFRITKMRKPRKNIRRSHRIHVKKRVLKRRENKPTCYMNNRSACVSSVKNFSTALRIHWDNFLFSSWWNVKNQMFNGFEKLINEHMIWCASHLLWPLLFSFCV